MNNENQIETEGQDGLQIDQSPPEVSLSSLKEGRIAFKELAKEDKARIAAEARESLPDDDAKEAWDMGWRSEEFFGGKKKDGTPKEFVDYKTFLKNINEAAPIKNERLRTLSKEVEEERKANDELRSEMRKILELNRMSQERTILSEEEKIQQELREAEEYSDVARYKAAELKRQQLEQSKLKLKSFLPEEQEAPRVPDAAQQDPFFSLPVEIQQTVQNWTAVNQWYFSDPKITDYCNTQSGLLAKARPELSMAERLEIVKQSAQTVFPEIVGQSPRETVLPSRRGAAYGGNAKAPTPSFESLSQEEQAQGLQLIRLGVYKDKADLMKQYRSNSK